MDSGAQALGCTVIAAGSDDAIAVADVMRTLKPRAFVGAPEFLKRLIDVSGGRDGTATVKRALVAGEPLTAELRREFASAGIAVQECLVHPDVGIIAYESDALDGMIVNEGLIVEIVQPGSGEPRARRRGRRDRRHRVQSRLSDDPACDRPALGDPARPLARAGAPTCGSGDCSGRCSLSALSPEAPEARLRASSTRSSPSRPHSRPANS